MKTALVVLLSVFSIASSTSKYGNVVQRASLIPASPVLIAAQQPVPLALRQQPILLQRPPVEILEQRPSVLLGANPLPPPLITQQQVLLGAQPSPILLSPSTIPIGVNTDDLDERNLILQSAAPIGLSSVAVQAVAGGRYQGLRNGIRSLGFRGISSVVPVPPIPVAPIAPVAPAVVPLAAPIGLNPAMVGAYRSQAGLAGISKFSGLRSISSSKYI